MECVPLPEEYLRFDSSWAIGAMSFAAVGIIITCLVIGTFIRYVDTPVVRASGRELSFQFGIGFCFSVVYSALLTKTNRIARIFNAGKKSAARPHFITPASQLVICSLLIFVQIPEAFNESKYIGFTMYTTCVIWLAFVPIYFSTANHVALRITTMCISISLSATIAITCLFTPKLYIILLASRAER
ncbi:putative metabotropic glutamate receptor mgl-1 [Amphibalanus amphitrite]|uniref:Putative metabotropic glutamate receptor mgl-1 n=1 Tax=Amphibalanus amphitrite TaxID=1232801 RepID=A0A6A4WJA0_AMPAM|nr:putative metabotropic glutamate receptor mgl-1 [Amphibalanus amphitrite]